jgi:hypothetical protein
LRGQAQSVAPIAQEHIPCRTQLIRNPQLEAPNGVLEYWNNGQVVKFSHPLPFRRLFRPEPRPQYVVYGAKKHHKIKVNQG